MKNINININKRDKIEGALYGFVIGDALGAATECFTKEEVENEFGEISSVDVRQFFEKKIAHKTDNTDFMLCVSDAIMTRSDGLESFKMHCMDNFIQSYDKTDLNAKIQCVRAIQEYINNGRYMMEDKTVLDCGSLMRALPCALIGGSVYNLYNIEQGKLTHNNSKCTRIILEYTRVIQNIFEYRSYDLKLSKLLSPNEYAFNVLNNALYYFSNTSTFEDSVIGAVNDGGASNSIAALAGSFAGAKYGISGIPSLLVESIDEEAKKKSKKFINFCFYYLQIWKNVV